MSQLDLGIEAEVSTRHLAFIETGRAHPSRAMIERLAGALDLPLRDRNALLQAAGFTPAHGETAVDAPALARMRAAIDLILKHHEPYPAFVVSRHFDILHTNDAAARVNAFVTGGRPGRHTNLLHQVFDPEDFRRYIVNWDEVAQRFLKRLRDELLAAPLDHAGRALLKEITNYPGVPPRWSTAIVDPPPGPVLAVTFASPAGPLRFFETTTAFAAPNDVTLAELRIDCAFPADEETAAVCAKLAG